MLPTWYKRSPPPKLWPISQKFETRSCPLPPLCVLSSGILLLLDPLLRVFAFGTNACVTNAQTSVRKGFQEDLAVLQPRQRCWRQARRRCGRVRGGEFSQQFRIVSREAGDRRCVRGLVEFSYHRRPQAESSGHGAMDDPWPGNQARRESYRSFGARAQVLGLGYFSA